MTDVLLGRLTGVHCLSPSLPRSLRSETCLAFHSMLKRTVLHVGSILYTSMWSKKMKPLYYYFCPMENLLNIFLYFVTELFHYRKNTAIILDVQIFWIFTVCNIVHFEAMKFHWQHVAYIKVSWKIFNQRREFKKKIISSDYHLYYLEMDSLGYEWLKRATLFDI